MNCIEHRYQPWDAARLYCPLCGDVVDTRIRVELDRVDAPQAVGRVDHPRPAPTPQPDEPAPVGRGPVTPDMYDAIIRHIDEVAEGMRPEAPPADHPFAANNGQPPRPRVPVDGDVLDPADNYMGVEAGL